MADPPEPDPTISAREQYRQHSDDPGCRGCHELIDPVGFAFEGYDSMGRFRTTDPGGHPIDATGEVAIVETHGSEPTRAPVDGAVDLAHAIAGSADLSDCVTRQWFRYALSRHEEERGEACLIDDLRARFDASGGDVAELVVAIVTSPAFRHAASN
jgi:hypothetical protein